MPWIYHQRTGILQHNGRQAGKGYSGAPGAVNDPDQEFQPYFGPIPRGRWRIGALHHSHTLITPNGKKKKLVKCLPLTPVGHSAHGRTHFWIHGDNDSLNQSASEGCIILQLDPRLHISKSHDRELKVVQ